MPCRVLGGFGVSASSVVFSPGWISGLRRRTVPLKLWKLFAASEIWKNAHSRSLQTGTVALGGGFKLHLASSSGQSTILRYRCGVAAVLVEACNRVSGEPSGYMIEDPYSPQMRGLTPSQVSASLILRRW